MDYKKILKERNILYCKIEGLKNSREFNSQKSVDLNEEIKKYKFRYNLYSSMLKGVKGENTNKK